MATKRKAGILLSEKDLRKRYPESNIADEICITDNTLKLPSHNLALNYHLGGGIKYGTIIELAGEESTGKTLLAMDFVSVAQSLGGVGLWDDAECSFDGKWAKSHGVDLERLELLPYENEFEIVSDWMADMCIYYRNKLTNNEPIVLVVDSLALMETGDAMEVAEVDAKAEMGRRSFSMGKLLRKRMRIFAKYGICVIFINQLRQKVGASQFEEKDTTPLQQAMKFYASQRLWLYKGKRIKRDNKPKGDWVGNIVYVRTKKNKVAIPRNNIQAEVYFRKDGENYGYHKYHGFEDLVVKKRIIKKKGNSFYYDGNLIAKSQEKLKDKIALDSELRADLIKKLKINTVSVTRKRLEKMDENLYPVNLKTKKDEEPNEEETIG
jgi:recombination protein RecA